MTSLWDRYLDNLNRRFLDWADQAPCSEHTDELFTASEKDQMRVASKYCSKCPSQLDCLIYSISFNEIYGVWGGTTENRRRVLMKRVYTLDERPSRLIKNIELIAKEEIEKSNEATITASA